MKSFRWCLKLLLVLALSLVGLPLLAQIQTGEIFGKVSDESGTVVAGAAVTLESPALIKPLSAVTTASGAYRFPNVPIGIYSVRFELPGFARLVREGVRIETGFNAEVNARMRISAHMETVTVSGQSPVVDTKATAIGATFTKEMLQYIPSARDPWVILEQTPGFVMDRQNVGGNQSGQQSSFVVHGGGAGNAMWNVDGVTITDMAATGFSPIYFDFDSFEEIQIQTGGNDASLETGGVNLNLVTKSGSNTFRGSGRFFIVDKAIQSDNITGELREQGAGAGAPIKNIQDYGFELGGPILRDKAWFWGAFGKQDVQVGVVGFLKPGATDPYDPDSLETDLTVLENYNAKIQWQWGSSQKTTLFFTRGDKIRNAREAGPQRPPETTYRQSGPTNMYKLSHQWTVNSRLMLEATASYVDGGFVLDFQSPELADVQRRFDIATGMWGRSYQRSGPFDRPTTEIKVDGNTFLSKLLGGDHSIKFGARYRDTPYSGELHVGGNATARFDRGVPAEADLHRDSNAQTALEAWSAYISDSYDRGRLRLNLGVRADYQNDEALPSSIPANPIIPDLLPAVEFTGADSGVTYFDISPRLGLTYDLRGNGKTVAKASAARYYGQGIYTADTLNPVTSVTLRYPWRDLNGDDFVQRNELDLNRLLNIGGNYDPANPASPTTPNRVDSDLKNDRTDELIVGIEHELAPNLGVAVSYIWRRYDRFAWEPRIGLSSQDYVPVTFTAACRNGTCPQESYTVTYYELPFRIPAAQLLTNQDFHRSYQGIELVARKRFSNRWMMNGSFTYNDTRAHYDSDRGFQDPTNIAFLDGNQTGTLNVRWMAKLSGMYAFPWGINASAFLNVRQGRPFNRTIQSPTRRGAIGRVNVLVAPNASERYEDFLQLDARVEKWFNLGRGAQVAASLDVFNVTNENTVLSREARQNLDSANRVLTILAPRVARFGVRFKF